MYTSRAVQSSYGPVRSRQTSDATLDMLYCIILYYTMWYGMVAGCNYQDPEFRLEFPLLQVFGIWFGFY